MKATPTDDAYEALGQCYAEAFKLLESLVLVYGSENLVLVHGRPTLTRPPHVQYGHAWVEAFGRQCSGSGPLQGRWISKEQFYRVGQIDPALNLVYTYQQAARFILSHGHWGPWEGVDAAPPRDWDEKP